MRQIAVSLLLFSMLTACMGDGVVVVAGQLRSESRAALDSCQLQLIVPSSEMASYYTEEIEPPAFSLSFTVAPRDENYPLVITCAGHEPYRSTVRYASGESSPRDLGVITLRVLRNGT